MKRAKRVVLSEHIKAYVAFSEQTNRSAKRKDGRVLNAFAAFVGDRAIDTVRAFDIERWKTARAKDVEKSTVNRELNVVRGCFSRAVEWGHLSVSPLATVKPYRVDNVRRRILSVAEIKALLAACSPDLALIARTTLESLMPLSEPLQIAVGRAIHLAHSACTDLSSHFITSRGACRESGPTCRGSCYLPSA
jgi:site-specific recombinase XerD